jgi:hypothetical protein
VRDHLAPVEIVQDSLGRALRRHGPMSIRTEHPCYPAGR